MTASAVRFARFAADTAHRGLGREERTRAATWMLDTVGVMLAGRTCPTGRQVAEVVAGRAGKGAATAIGVAEPLPAADAALVNGTLAHSLDFDDTHLPSVLHPSASVVPAALAVAQETAASPARLLDALTLGNELNVRLGMAGYDTVLGNSQYFERGQHATAICGALGAALAAGVLYGLDADGLAHAVGIAASMGSGLLEANRTGGTVKRVHCGWAAHSGITAAQFALGGLTAPPTVLDGRFGFLRAWLDEPADPEAVTRDLGDHWESARIQIKPYPCNHFLHAAVDAALQLRRRGLRVDDIEAVEAAFPTAVLRTVAEPAEVKKAPADGYAAKFSAPYVIATALLGGAGLGVGLADFTDEAVTDPARLALAARVRCAADPVCDTLFPRSLPAGLLVRIRGGQEGMLAHVPVSRGGEGNELGPDDLLAKFHDNAALVMPEERGRELGALLAALPEVTGEGERETARLAALLTV
ncbi:MmgE/PrpD family protein [Streptantibioticus cattleyicolor]|uniref:MmgE/PrpD n=1 Tax=Streptantibioticus cattleyicolor (strain ATCC 35852 / DSM 46488 / JCM 4925 / NBRC 14057 / NRRL 8057) TaxID=1003195 RepID=F8JJY8_STREN|nr:MmgE/PrpD family protein [Streptantibioticus cattleyicolor]AEW98580.1 MmgE/PrpD [Streptantibioticus cattleyicolor NRRL 8057 = DSM 46488]CCB72362.1 conserved protein of unknown function [Streptantibioticus cattleyicolor NRRL 8057 = DSM 46488]